MRAVALLLFLLLLPLALSGESIPPLPAFYWGEVNSACALTELAPGIVVQAAFDGNVVASVPVTEREDGIYRFGGPSATDEKLMVVGLQEGNEFNVLLHVNGNARLVLGTEDFNAGEVRYLFFEINSSRCSSLFPPARYEVKISIPSDCNGSLDGLPLKAYHGGEELASTTLTGTTSSSKTVTIDGLSKSLREGSTIVFKVCNGSHCVSEGTSYNYGEQSVVDFGTVSCSALFPQPGGEQLEEAPPADTNAASPEGGTEEGEGEPEEEQTVGDTGRKSVPTDESDQNREVLGARPSKGEEGGVVSRVVDAVSGTARKIFGMPTDVALILALVVVIIIVVVLRFVL